MPEKDFSLLQQLAAAIGIGGVAWLSIFKFMAQGKDNAEFKKEVNKTVSAQNVKIEKIESNVIQLKIGIKDEFTQHRDYLHDNYMDEPTVKDSLKRLESAQEAMINRVMAGQQANNLKLDRIEEYITNRRTQKMTEQADEIKDLKTELSSLKDK